MAPTYRVSIVVILLQLLLAFALHVIEEIPVIQQNTDGGQAVDCGAGPVSLNADTRDANNMDSVINKLWDGGISTRSKFDVHQELADQDDVDLYCANSLTNYKGDPSSCSQLKGTTKIKSQGWLGIKVLMAVQDTFLGWGKVVFNGAVGLTSLLANLNKPAKETGRKLTDNMIDGAIGGLTALVASSSPGAAVSVTLAAALMATLTKVANESFKSKQQGIIQRVTVSKVLEFLWRESFNSFLIYIPNGFDNCQKWRTNAWKDDVLCYCAPTGSFLLFNIHPRSKLLGSPPRAMWEDLVKILGYNIR